MGFFKKGNISEKEQKDTWYNERYMSVSVQRNFLLIFLLIMSIALFVCLAILKNVQDGKTTTPYLIEYDDNTGKMMVVEAESKKDYTAQQAVKESFFVQYLQHREAIRLSTLEEDMNFVRVMTTESLYDSYVKKTTELVQQLRDVGQLAKFSIDIESLKYVSSQSVKVRIKRHLIDDNGKVLKSEDFDIDARFGFAQLELTIDEMRANPLGFQVVAYKSTPVTEIQTAIKIINEDRDNNQNVNQ